MRSADSPRRMRVLQVGKYYPPYRGGIETHLQVLCEELKQEVELEVLVASGDRLDRVERVDGVEVTRVGTAFHLAGAPVCPGMVSRIRGSDADIVHLHLPNPAAVMAYLASGHRGRLVVSWHSDVIRQRLLDAAFFPIQRRLLNRTDAIVAATPNYVRSSPVLSRYPERCRVIPYGIPVEGLSRGREEGERLRERFGPRLVVGVGRLVYYKGFEHLVQAMTQVDGKLLIVGDGPLRGALEDRVRELGLGGRVVLLGKVDDIAPFFHAADVFVLPSIARSEAFGIVQLEAMACGKPVVNTSLDSGVPYVSRDGESGLTVPPGRADALARAVNRLLDDPELRARYGEAAARRVQEEFSQITMARRMVELYREVLDGSSLVRERAPGAAPRSDLALLGGA